MATRNRRPIFALMMVASSVLATAASISAQTSQAANTALMPWEENYDSSLQEDGRRQLDVATTEKFIRPIVKSVNNGGKLTVKLNQAVEFPDDMVSQLNTLKEALIVMQVVTEGSLPEPIPSYPVNSPTDQIDPATDKVMTLDQQNKERAEERAAFPDVVDWEALSVTDRSLTFRVLFANPLIISADEGMTDTLFVTINLAAFKSLEGNIYIPDGSQIKRNLPAQMSVDTAETYEKIGKVVSWVFLALLGANGGLNTMFESLDYSALMDAIEGPQLAAFIPAMNVKLPPNVNYFLSTMKDATAVEPSEKLKPDEAPSISDNVFGEQPESEPLNDRLATIGYESMTPAAEVSTVSTMFGMQLGGVLIMFISHFGHKQMGSMLAERFKLNMQNFVLWGTLINLIMIYYLPVLISTFISVVGMRWETDTTAALANNIWTLMLLQSWLLCPPLMFLVLYRNKNDVGRFKLGAVPTRDPMKVKWKLDWAKK